MRLLLVTHAETDWNAQGRFQGHAAAPLNERGRAQAAWLRERLANEALQAIIASDLPRAWQTAEIITAAHDLRIETEPRLRELHFGEWEGLTYAEVRDRQAQALADWHNVSLPASPPGGETLASLAQRLQAFLHDLREHREESVLLVAHRGCLRVLLCLLLGVDVQKHWEFRLGIASLSELMLATEKAEVVRLNEGGA
jgi:alpha-ribazole phosphatase